MKNNFNDKLLLILGLLFSTFVVFASPKFYFSPDLEDFWKWSIFWGNDWRSIYTQCASCNYPILGLFSSAGLMNLVGQPDFNRTVFLFRLILSFVDGLNVFLIFLIAKWLNVHRPAALAGLIGVLVSTWAGGALWGQIDSISQFFILLTLGWLVWKNTHNLPAGFYGWYLAIAAFLSACVMLTKQLTIFSLGSIGLFLLTDLIFSSPDWKFFFWNFSLTLLVFLLSITSPDFFINLPAGYYSHLVYIWTVGGQYAWLDRISANGFNIWTLIQAGWAGSAHDPIFPQVALTNPYFFSRLLTLLLSILFTYSLGRFLWEKYQAGEKTLSREIILNFILHLSLINLCFNVFLTGTHERYLAHFYPFIILAWAGLSTFNRHFSGKLLPSLLLIGSSLYGLFILQILSSLDFKLGLVPQIILAIFHFGLFVFLMLITIRYQADPSRSTAVN